MTPSDKSKFFETLLGAIEVLGRPAMSTAGQLTWFEALKDYDIDDVVKAFNAEVKNPDRKKFFPDPGDIIRQIEGTSSEKAMIAWNVVSKCGLSATDTAIFEDPIIHQVITDMGGWISFNDPKKWMKFEDGSGYTDQQFAFFRKEFLDRYTTMLKTGAPNAPKKLIGFYEISNRDTHPEHVPEPIRITHDGKKLLPEWKPVLKLLEPEPEKNDEPIDVEAIKEQVKKFLDAPF